MFLNGGQIPRAVLSSMSLARRCRLLSLLFLTTALLDTLPRTASALDFKYHNQAQIGKFFRKMTKNYPDIVSAYSIGKSYGGQDLLVLSIGKYAKRSEPLVPNVKYIANMHGNEVVGREMLLHLAEHFLEGYETNETLRAFLDKTTVHLMPTMNPDGFSKSMVKDCRSVMGRANNYNYDLNRNFPDPYKSHQDALQRETQLVDTWTKKVPFVLSANLHGGAEVVNYPWDSLKGDMTRSQYAACPDDDVFRHLSLTYSKSHPTMHQGASCGDQFQDGITNGANWYPVLGGMADYMYRNGRGYEVLIEMSCCKYPDPYTLPDFWDKNRDALINMLFAVHMGVKGIVAGPNSAFSREIQPIAGAQVSVEGREEISTYTSNYGEFFRLLLPGNYTIKVVKKGYYPRSVPFTVYGHDNVTVLKVRLVPLPAATATTVLTTFSTHHDNNNNLSPEHSSTNTPDSSLSTSDKAPTRPQNTKTTTANPNLGVTKGKVETSKKPQGGGPSTIKNTGSKNDAQIGGRIPLPPVRDPDTQERFSNLNNTNGSAGSPTRNDPSTDNDDEIVHRPRTPAPSSSMADADTMTTVKSSVSSTSSEEQEEEDDEKTQNGETTEHEVVAPVHIGGGKFPSGLPDGIHQENAGSGTSRTTPVSSPTPVRDFMPGRGPGVRYPNSSLTQSKNDPTLTNDDNNNDDQKLNENDDNNGNDNDAPLSNPSNDTSNDRYATNSPLGSDAPNSSSSSIIIATTTTTSTSDKAKEMILQAVARIFYTFLVVVSSSVLSS